MVMEITNSRRVLVVSLADSTQHLSRVIQDLTGTIPEPASASLAGTTHLLPLKTNYYTVEVPIWLDLISSPAEWSASFLSPEAEEVLSVLGGLAIVFAIPPAPSSSSSSADPPAVPTLPAPSAEETRELISQVGKVVRDGLGGWSWDGVTLGVGVGEGDADEWEDLCAQWGLEFVQVRGKKDEGRNEFGEKMGIARIIEALEANDWAGDDAPDLDAESDSDVPRRLAADGADHDELDLDPESLDFGFDRSDFEGLKKAIWGLDEDPTAGSAAAAVDDHHDATDESKKNHEPADDKKVTPEKNGEGSTDKTKTMDENEDLNSEDVEKIDNLIRKMQAVRDLSAGLPFEQRRKMARKAVNDVLKEL